MAKLYHYNYYRYVRMMLRRYPKMRLESFWLRSKSNSGVIGLSGRVYKSQPAIQNIPIPRTEIGDYIRKQFKP